MHKVFKAILVITFITISAFKPVIAQSASVETVLDSHKIILGRFTELKYVVIKNINDKITLPAFNDTLFDGVEIAGKAKIDSNTLENSKIQIQQKLIITAYETGMRYIPPFPFIIQTQTGFDTLYSASSYLQVEGIVLDTTGVIRDIKDIEWVMPTPRDFLSVMIVLAIIGLVVFLTIYFWPKNKGTLQIEPPKISEPAYIIALKELDKLKAQKLWQQKLIKEYYSRLTSIIRTYIEQQYGIMAMEETTSEIVRDIKNAGLDQKMNMIELQSLLNLADLVKFARGEAQPEENIAHLEIAYDFVKTSREVLVEDAVKAATNEIHIKLTNSYKISKNSQNAKGLSDYQIFNELEKGARLVRYQFTVSIIVVTFTRESKIYLLKPDEKGIRQGIIYSSITLLLGWWGIPWGPVRSVISLKNNFAGGKKVELE
jgi:hypothetical protein